MNANWLGLAAAVLLLVFVLELLRRGILRERFAALWLVVCASWARGAVPQRPDAAPLMPSDSSVASNLLFFSAIVFLLLVASS